MIGLEVLREMEQSEEIKEMESETKKLTVLISITRKRKELRQSHIEEFQKLKSLSFLEFLFEVGMFVKEKKLEGYSEHEKMNAYNRYLDALSASVKGTGSVFLKRETKDLFTNNFNRRLLGIHKANHDIQMVVDQVSYL